LDPRDYPVSGGGRFAGIVLVGPEGWRDTMLEVILFNRCTTRGCRPPGRRDDLAFLTDRRGEWTDTLPAGDYTLYLIADGSPVEVVLNLRGPTGITRLTPPPSRNLTIKTLRTVVAAGPKSLQVTYGAAGTGRLGPRGGLIGERLWYEGV
jgi:hypothetical protein